ncbi:hypothetical protein F7734_32615 [Scytonema sp. UIC 10036]|uniref:hypothetical protein n=1 Tax=Scytonema sp. UIC 10036 TaxID=2304196 RepID=UPI0012DAF064|nr:hypothetical protein [Scytonema sp. UIC 10036]MUG96831.1 hypothetical protein [Scytonema sp. UIC 10036]
MDWIKSLLEAPIKTILVVAGLAFIITAVVGKLSSWVELNYRWQRWLVGILGVIFLIIGINQDIKSDSDSAKKGTQPPNTTPPITSTSPPITSTSPPLTTQPTTSPLTNNNLSGKWKVSHQGKSGFSISQ